MRRGNKKEGVGEIGFSINFPIQSKGKVETTENIEKHSSHNRKQGEATARCEGHMDRGMQREVDLVRHSGLGGVGWME